MAKTTGCIIPIFRSWHVSASHSEYKQEKSNMADPSNHSWPTVGSFFTSSTGAASKMCTTLTMRETFYKFKMLEVFDSSIFQACKSFTQNISLWSASYVVGFSLTIPLRPESTFFKIMHPITSALVCASQRNRCLAG